MRLINKKTKANTTISNPQKGLHPFIRKVGVSFSFLWGILFQELARLRIIPASPDKIKEKIKSNQIKIIRTHRKTESMSVRMMLLCLSLYSCLFVYLRVFVYSCIRVFVYSCIRVSTNERECNDDQIFCLHEEHFILKMFRSSNTKDADVFF